MENHKAPFEFATSAGGLIEIKLRGHWHSGDVDEFERARLRMMDDLFAKRVSVHGQLIDLRESQIQSQDVAARLKELIAKAAGPAKTAVLLPRGSALLKMQAERVGGKDNQEFFDDDEAARAWLRGERPME